MLMGCKQSDKEILVLVGTYTDTDSDGLYAFRFNQENGHSLPLSVAPVDNPSFLTLTPDGKTIYAVTEQQKDAAVSSLSLDAETGKMEILSRQKTDGRGTCHVTWLGSEVVASNYSSGSMTVFPLCDDGNLEQGKLIQFLESGPDTVRQATSHIHSSQLSPDGKHLFVIDLGGDYIYSYPVSGGRVSGYEPQKIKVEPGQGPRHFTFSADGRYLYLLTELGGYILVYEICGDELVPVQKIEADPLHARGSADIHFSPDGRFLYASNRLRGDGLAIFSQNPHTGKLAHAGYQQTKIHPRNFAITPNGRYVLVACRDSNCIQVFERDTATGLLTDIFKDIIIPHPVCVITD